MQRLIWLLCSFLLAGSGVFMLLVIRRILRSLCLFVRCLLLVLLPPFLGFHLGLGHRRRRVAGVSCRGGAG